MTNPLECTCEATCCCESSPESGGLKPGPLTPEMVPLLTPGRSRLLVVNADTYLARHNLGHGALATFRSSDGRYIDVSEIGERNGSVFSRFEYVGESAPANPEPIADRWADLERLAKAATPGDLDSADHKGEGSYECPCCNGDGQVEGKTFTNFDGYAIGVQFFGVGNEFTNYEAFSRAANPAAILELIATARQQPNREG